VDASGDEKTLTENNIVLPRKVLYPETKSGETPTEMLEI
jgi:hypothetical protein